mgnify:CR=1 FL=1
MLVGCSDVDPHIPVERVREVLDDLHLLAVAQGVRPEHRSDTLRDILSSPEREAWLDWVRARNRLEWVRGEQLHVPRLAARFDGTMLEWDKRSNGLLGHPLGGQHGFRCPADLLRDELGAVELRDLLVAVTRPPAKVLHMSVR